MTMTTRDALADFNAAEITAEEEALLSDMEALAADAGDWRNHLPYVAALRFHESAELRGAYESHVDECEFCQRLVDTLHPTDRVLNELHTVRTETISRALGGGPNPAKSNSLFERALPVAASLLIGIVVTSSVFLVRGNSGITSIAGFEKSVIDLSSLESAKLATSQLVSLERSEEPLAKFQAARIYLATKNPEIAYKRIGEGFALAQFDKQIVQSVSTAPILPANTPYNTDVVTSELRQLLAKGTLNANDLLRVMQLRAQIGQHKQALESLYSYLEATNAAPRVVNEFATGALGLDKPIESKSTSD